MTVAEKNASECGTPSKCKAKEEKIFVTVRVRPLSSREIAHKDTVDWECPNQHTVSYKHALPDRSPFPTSYTFDRVFGPESSTEVVYEEGAKDVALSALTGINSTIFAYGQTSSGKTFTMKGVIESAVVDIYAYIEKNKERNFILRISGLEIYNEVVRDLLNPDSGPLRLLDDPERGTIVEKLVENVVRDNKHLRQVLSVCEAQRQVGETMLNDASSRSHQIIRLTVESIPRCVVEGSAVNSMVASLNFVDLAGSERASQSLADGARLKEGCHINRSLLTLSTVIRKLSGGRAKSGHIPYRDSKLTRILQLSLGGNARTAIICTMSPAHAHVEQSRNTLSFATRAKEVTNTAHVNLVVSDKDLVKQLQREVARLEAELRVPEAVLSSEALLQEKELQILKMESEMKELVRQRDAAKAQLNEVLLKIGDEDGVVVVRKESCVKEEEIRAPLMLVQEIRKLEKLQDELGEDASRALEALQKEVECLRLAQVGMNQDAAATIAKLQEEIKNLHNEREKVRERRRGEEEEEEKREREGEREEGGEKEKEKEKERERLGCGDEAETLMTSLRDEITRLQAIGCNNDRNDADTAIATLEEQLESVQISLDKLVLGSPNAANSSSSPSKFRTPSRRKGSNNNNNSSSSSAKQRLFSAPSPPCSPSPSAARRNLVENNENTPPQQHQPQPNPNLHHQQHQQQHHHHLPPTPTKPSDSSPHRRSTSVDIRKMQNLFKTAAEDNIKSIRAYVTDLKERVAKLQYQKQLLVCQVLELEANSGGNGKEEIEDGEESTPPLYSPSTWRMHFHKQRMQIIEMWDTCQVSIIHRTQFYLLFKGGDPADAMYMEVEFRRLVWLQDNFANNSDYQTQTATTPATTTTPSILSTDDDTPSATTPNNNISSFADSCRALRRERELLAKRMRRLTGEEREEIFGEWKVGLETKQRKLQVAEKVWTDINDMEHIERSAKVVARIVGFWEGGNCVSKEMFALNFAPPSSHKPWQFGWNSISTILNL